MRLHFDAFVLDSGTRQLFHEGRERPLRAKAFDLLELLLGERPNVVAKKRIRDRLWPATVVSDSTLATVANELRTALGDDTKEPRLLRTVHGVGYAFCGEATESGPPRRAASSGELSYRLVLKDREISLHEGENVLGRVEDGVVWIESPTVSRRHARIVVEGGRAILEDLASKNGTFLRGERIARPTPLSDGDEIRLGRVRMGVRALPASKATETDLPDS
jgi:DNA-binding winged helix-turn-helix (wHTH) protein